jgi:hypothetical protein
VPFPRRPEPRGVFSRNNLHKYCQQDIYKRTLKLVFTKTLKLGKHPPSPQRRWRDESAVAAAMATGRAEMSLKNLITDGADFTDAMKDSIIAGRV